MKIILPILVFLGVVLLSSCIVQVEDNQSQSSAESISSSFRNEMSSSAPVVSSSDALLSSSSSIMGVESGPSECPFYGAPTRLCGDGYRSVDLLDGNGCVITNECERIDETCTEYIMAPGLPCAKNEEPVLWTDSTSCTQGYSCETVPEVCAEIFSPVCDAEGNTYSNECVAHSQRVFETEPCAPLYN